MVDGFKYVVVGIDNFTKWSEARPIKDKSAVTVARFLYDEIVCRHGCSKIKISVQGKKIVNTLNDELFRLIGTEQRVTSAYHPQANGLVERQNRTIKNCLLKILQENVLQWPYILQGVLFAHRTVQHSSTGYTPFKMLYQCDATLPIDINYDDKYSVTTNSNQYNSDH
ncbi:Integrase catalytic domain-containing protein [Aphis craccivora]|uniref:Integrase catalytic domain-containing protein n=1 Tax=Aphis craccivora TaxID=307492 RepID=A0A6G0YA19_APHCR|nr:Integrase catalytic domain-containing protein [Aphis craccivora]